MPITLASLVQQPALGLTALAGADALDREISWVHTSELVDPTPYLQGGELLLSVGLWLGRGGAGAEGGGAAGAGAGAAGAGAGAAGAGAAGAGRGGAGRGGAAGAGAGGAGAGGTGAGGTGAGGTGAGGTGAGGAGAGGAGAGGAGHRAQAAQIGRYVERLVEAGVIGLGFGTGPAHEAVPGPLVDAAAARGLPLLEVPERTPFIAVSRIVWESLAADQYAEVTRTSQAQQELTRTAVASGAAGLVSRLAERLGAWVVLLDAAGSVQHAAPAGAAQEGPWLGRELDRLRDVTTPVSTTLSVDGDQIVVQSIRPGHRTRGFLAVGLPRRPTPEQRTMLNTAVSLLTLMLAQATALRTAESRLRTTIFDLLAGGNLVLAGRLATDLWDGLPAAPVRLLLVAGPQPLLGDLVEVVDAASAVAAERLFFAQLTDRVTVIYTAAGRLRSRVLAACAAAGRLVVGESTGVGLTELGRAYREAEQALDAGLRVGRPHTSFADVGAAGLLGLLATPQAVAFAESLLRPLVEHDATARGELVRSLSAWLDHNGQWDAAAAALGVHRHTLRHRMRRVQELLGSDLDVAAVRAELWAAVQVRTAVAGP